MLKTNTVLTAACTLLLGLLAFLGHGIWDDVAAIKNATTATSVQVQTINRTLEDHEARIRQNEHEVIILQQQRDDHTARSPKLSENRQP